MKYKHMPTTRIEHLLYYISRFHVALRNELELPALLKFVALKTLNSLSSPPLLRVTNIALTFILHKSSPSLIIVLASSKET